jgi:Uri superfamily endonuclease
VAAAKAKVEIVPSIFTVGAFIYIGSCVGSQVTSDTFAA